MYDEYPTNLGRDGHGMVTGLSRYGHGGVRLLVINTQSKILQITNESYESWIHF